VRERERERGREGERESGWRGEGGREERESLVSFEVEGARINREIGCSLIFQTPVRSLNRERKTNGGREGEREREREREVGEGGRGTRAHDAAAEGGRRGGRVCALAPGRILAFVKPRHGVRSLQLSCLVPRALPCHALPCHACWPGLTRSCRGPPPLLPYYSLPAAIIRAITDGQRRESLSHVSLPSISPHFAAVIFG